jgi:hypothetical protein
MTALDSARLDFEMSANILERALGRGGAPIDLDVARKEVAAVADAAQRLASLLERGGDPVTSWSQG